MPHGSRIVLLSALVLTGCHSAEKRTDPLLSSTRPPTSAADSQGRMPAATPARGTPATPAARAGGTYSPTVTNEQFQRPIAQSGPPQPNLMPPLGTGTIPGPTYPPAAPIPPIQDVVPMNPPGAAGGLTVPPTAEGNIGDLKIPSMMGPK